MNAIRAINAAPSDLHVRPLAREWVEPAAAAAPAGADRVSPVGAPVSFGGSVGLLYPGDGPLAVLMLSAIGYEEMCVRTTWRTLAETISAAGAPCLRFDYPGVGDGLDPRSAPDGVEDWLQSVRDAADCLRRATGRDRIVVVGQGLGGAFAALIARELGPLAGVAYLAPVTNGRLYLRELSFWARMLTDRIGIGPDPDDAGGHAVAGLVLEEGRARTIKTIDLSKLTEAPSEQALVVGRVNHGGDERFADHLATLGASVARLDYEGYEVLATDPTQATPPRKLIDAVADWVVRLARRAPELSSPSLRSAVELEPAVLIGDGFAERPIRFGCSGELFGVLCEPDRPSGAPAVLFSNAGRDYHIGWARATVDQARAFARAGVASLRFDAAGIGDSPARPTSPSEVLYSQDQVDDVRTAIDCLQDHGYARTTLVGRCSGAYAAFNAAVQDPRIDEIVMINAERFVWDPRENIAEALRYAHRSIGDFGATLWRRGGWRRLFKGQLRVAAAGKYVTHRLVRKASVRLAPHLGELTDEARLYREVHRRFAGLTKRNVKVWLVYSEGDLGLTELHTYFGKDGRKLAAYRNIRRAMVPAADHNFTHSGARARLLVTLKQILVP